MSDNIKLLKNYLLYFLLMFLVCIVGTSNVFADTMENIGYLNDNSEVLVEVSYTGNPLPLQRLGEYQLSQVEAMNINISNYNFIGGTSYVLEFYTPNTTLSYANTFTAVGNTLDNQTVNCSTTGIGYHDNKYLDLKFNCSSSVNYISLRIYNNQNNYIMDSGIFSWHYVYLRKVNSGTDTSILESQNAQIIQGQQDIINNQNENTKKQIESQKVCNNIDRYSTEEGKYLNNNGTTLDNTAFGVTDYIKLNNTTTIKITSSYNGTWTYYCFYNSNKTKISCSALSSLVANEYLTIPGNATYFRSTIRLSENHPTFEICTNGNQAVSDSINDLNDSLNDDDTDGATSEASEFFSSFTTNTFGLTSIITAPLNLIQSLTSSTCSALHLPLPYLNNKYLDLPCMTSIYQTHFGAFFTMYQTITYGIIAYWVCVRIFNQVKDFKNPEHDEIEVVDL